MLREKHLTLNYASESFKTPRVFLMFSFIYSKILKTEGSPRMLVTIKLSRVIPDCSHLELTFASLLENQKWKTVIFREIKLNLYFDFLAFTRPRFIFMITNYSQQIFDALTCSYFHWYHVADISCEILDAFLFLAIKLVDYNSFKMKILILY